MKAKTNLWLLFGIIFSIQITSNANPPHPILFVHGLGSAMDTWGALWSLEGGGETMSFSSFGKCPSDRIKTSCIPGWFWDACVCMEAVPGASVVKEYTSGSTAEYFADKYGCNKTKNSSGITNNGLYFYNSVDTFGYLAPFAPLGWDCTADGCGQTKQLYDKLVSSLNSFYGQGNWENNPNAKITLVAHSQGGLISRNLYRYATGTGLGNAVNHIVKIVTIGTPNTGSQWAKPSPTVEPLRRIKKDVLNVHSTFDSYLWWLELFLGDVDAHLGGVLKGSSELDGSGQFIQQLNAAGYPINRYTGKKVPIIALFSRVEGLGTMIMQHANAVAIAYQIEHPVEIASYSTAEGWDMELVPNSKSDVQTLLNLFNLGSSIGVDVALKEYNPILSQFETYWTPFSDMVVETSSQRMDGLSSGFPLVKKEVRRGEIVPHMTLKLSRKVYKGQTLQAQALYDAVEMKVTPNIIPITSLLLD